HGASTNGARLLARVADALPARQIEHALKAERAVNALTGRSRIEHRHKPAPRKLGAARFQNAGADPLAAPRGGHQPHADPGKTAAIGQHSAGGNNASVAGRKPEDGALSQKQSPIGARLIPTGLGRQRNAVLDLVFAEPAELPSLNRPHRGPRNGSAYSGSGDHTRPSRLPSRSYARAGYAGGQKDRSPGMHRSIILTVLPCRRSSASCQGVRQTSWRDREWI